MSNYSQRLDPKEGELMLRRKVELLEDFLAQGAGGSVMREKRCQALKAKIMCMEANIVRTVPQFYTQAEQFARLYFDQCETFLLWALMLIVATGQVEAARLYLGNPSFLSPNRTNLSSKSSDSSIYDCDPDDNRRASQTSSENPPDFTTIEFNELHPSLSSGTPSPKRSPQLGYESPPLKRIKLGANDQVPCLRCRMLKKKCDSLEQCSHCPQESFDNKNDYWKVLGCIRGGLRELATIFCPDFARSTRRTFRCKSGVLLVIDFNLTKSKVSIGKKRRILHLIQTQSDFAELHHGAWDTNLRTSLCRIAAKPLEPAEANNSPATNSFPCEDYEAPWALLQAVGMDQYYSKPTEYNAFSLFRLGNKFCSDKPAAVEIYLLERLCGFIVSENLTGPPPYDQSKLPCSNTLVLVDMKEDMEDFLCDFERICAGRANLSGDTQMACFYALLVFSITKSLLIDTYCIRAVCDDEYAIEAACDDVSPRKGTRALQINSAYKSLVSLFIWSSKVDVMLPGGSSNSMGSIYNAPAGLSETSTLVHLSGWEELGFKTTKDFLLRLGSIMSPAATYNAFFAQKYFSEAFVTSRPFDHSFEIAGHFSHRIKETATPPSPMKGPPKPPYTIYKFNVSSDPSEREEQEELPDSPSTLSPGPDTHGPGISGDTASDGASNTPKFAAPRLQSFTFVDHGHEASRGGSRRLRGGRRGALDDATSKKAREIRKVGACWNCWVMKVPCSEGHPCDRCKPKARITTHRICNRSPFAAYSDLLFPDGYNSRFTAGVVQLYIHENIAGFSEHALPVEISWIGHRNMELHATPFTLTPHGTAHQSYPGQSSQALGVESLLVGLAPLDIPGAEQDCIRYFESFLDNPANSALIFSNSMPTLSKRVVEAIYCYHHRMQSVNTLLHDTLLHDALLSHLILTAMSQPIKFTATSATSLVEQLKIQCPPSESFSSRMLDRQIKQILYSLNRKIVTRLLGNLERLIRGRKASSWPICFSTIIMLCLSMEQVQIQAWFHASSLKSSAVWRRQLPHEASRLLDELPFSQFSHLFHSIYRTTQVDKGGLNPFRGTIESHHERGFDPTALIMIGSFRTILNDVPLLDGRSQLPDLGQALQPFIKCNSGRLVSKFLAPFISRPGHIDQAKSNSSKQGISPDPAPTHP
ncbi:uncharacterized protein BP5553_05785 [Venustampulla echinocandica]|uniref:Zn(2)-C6 fungal-type domain-containing protein n=1 Tax=Venustampulla echinocandica TaxID=2656787 RepID=A0A370TLM9_9HELO|nr:uncharacterized protein BP5553_05785 [Venustampulla echinocandica]RDL36433.1 hypothetical protein BP5553_05785 [Venustampulla echinocandica]